MSMCLLMHGIVYDDNNKVLLIKYLNCTVILDGRRFLIIALNLFVLFIVLCNSLSSRHQTNQIKE